jgi:hypothetical protein
MIVLGSVAALAFASVSMEQSASVQLQGEHLHLPELSILAGASRGSGPDLSLPSSQLVGWLASSPDVRGDHDQGSSSEDKTEEQHKNEAERPGTAPKSESLDFDLLGAPAKAHEVDEHALRLRRTMLNWHQSVGLGMFALQLATTVVGQLNYDDKFGGANTGKYVQPHAVLAYSTVAAFIAAGTLALLAPAPLKRDEGFDRVALHKLSMFTATAGMAAQIVLGVWTQSREGYLNQQSFGTAHLVIGYVTLAAVAAGVGALVF